MSRDAVGTLSEGEALAGVVGWLIGEGIFQGRAAHDAICAIHAQELTEYCPPDSDPLDTGEDG